MAKAVFRKFVAHDVETWLIYVFFALFIVAAGVIDPVFLTRFNVNNLIVTLFPYLLASYAQTLVIITGGIDLSVGSAVTLSNVICATQMTQTTHGAAFAVAAALLSGAALGLANGVIIAKTRMQPLIVTLATSSIGAGAALAVMSKPGGTVHFGFAEFMGGTVADVPVVLFFGIAITAILWLLTNRTRYGQGLYAIGGNEASAFSSGIKTSRVKIATYFFASLLSALAGIFLTAMMYSGDPTVGDGYTMRSVIIAALGGANLMGGSGGVIGNVAGAGILVIINNILNLAGVSTFYQFIMQGVVLVAALMLGAFRNRRTV